MHVYLKSEQVFNSLKRLSSRKSEGKTPMERTSIMMYFLAFDAALKKANQSRLDLNPDKPEGKSNRKLIELEFAKLVFVGKDGPRIIQVCELGKISSDGKPPEKRISSNFLTVPLKKASEQLEPFSYPKRPPTPLIKMGPAATGIKWGMEQHDDWRVNFPKLFFEIKEPTVFTDLAIFVLRDVPFVSSSANAYVDTLSTALRNKFTTDLSHFWTSQIKKEQVMVKHIQEPFVSSHEPLLNICTFSEGSEYIDPEVLKERITYLERLLKRNNIAFK